MDFFGTPTPRKLQVTWPSRNKQTLEFQNEIPDQHHKQASLKWAKILKAGPEREKKAQVLADQTYSSEEQGAMQAKEENPALKAEMELNRKKHGKWI